MKCLRWRTKFLTILAKHMAEKEVQHTDEFGCTKFKKILLRPISSSNRSTFKDFALRLWPRFIPQKWIHLAGVNAIIVEERVQVPALRNKPCQIVCAHEVMTLNKFWYKCIQCMYCTHTYTQRRPPHTLIWLCVCFAGFIMTGWAAGRELNC